MIDRCSICLRKFCKVSPSILGKVHAPKHVPRVPVQDESVYLGLGSNVGNRIAHLRAGLASLDKHGLKLRTVSSFYLTEPDLRTVSGESMDTDAKQTGHPWYVNCVAIIDNAPTAEQLVNLCLLIEQENGRSRHHTFNSNDSFEPRTLDLDVLMIGERGIEDLSIQVPHPRMQNRRFVLAPLAEIASLTRHPTIDATIGEMLDALPERERVWLLAPAWSKVG